MGNMPQVEISKNEDGDVFRVAVDGHDLSMAITRLAMFIDGPQLAEVHLWIAGDAVIDLPASVRIIHEYQQPTEEGETHDT